jgi:hypothetical protein
MVTHRILPTLLLRNGGGRWPRRAIRPSPRVVPPCWRPDDPPRVTEEHPDHRQKLGWRPIAGIARGGGGGSATVFARMWAQVDEMRGITTVVFYGPRGCGPNRIPRTRARSPPCNRSARSEVRSGSARGRQRTGTESTAAGAAGQRAPQVSGSFHRARHTGPRAKSWPAAVGPTCKRYMRTPVERWAEGLGRNGCFFRWAERGIRGPDRVLIFFPFYFLFPFLLFPVQTPI